MRDERLFVNMQDAATNVTWLAYDPETGRQLAVTNALGQAVYTAYDNQGRVVGTWGATYPVAYDFDDYGRMVAMYTYRGTNTIGSYTDMLAVKAAMDRTMWLFDPATGIMTNKLYADNTGPGYSYTADGKLARRTWARGVATTYSYSQAGELTVVDYPAGTPDVTNRFDRLGRITNVVDGAGSRYFKYSSATLALTNETLGATVVSRTQDSLGRASGVSLGGSYAVLYTYSTIGRFAGLTSVAGGQSNVWSYSYMPHSELLQGWSNGIVSTVKSFESNRSLLTQVKNSGTNTVSQFDYQNDVLGRRTLRLDTGIGLTSGRTNTFGYNAKSELTAAVMGTNAFGYGYDPIGNRTVATNNGATSTYQANLLNQYTNVTTGAVQAKPAFDLDGNMTSNGVFTFAWDAENRLVSVSSNGSVVMTSAYDYMSRRVQKVAGSVTNTFVWDGWLLVRELSSTTTNYYVSGLDLSGSLQGAGGIGGILSVTRNGATYYPLCDGNGNITDLVSTNGTSLAHYEFDPYGNTIVKTGVMSDANPFRFSSKYYDGETGLYYYGYRYYDPVSGRWLGRDPIGERGGLGLYVFAMNRSVSVIDRQGLTGNQLVGAVSGGGNGSGSGIYANPYGPQTPGVVGPDGQQGLYQLPDPYGGPPCAFLESISLPTGFRGGYDWGFTRPPVKFENNKLWFDTEYLHTMGAAKAHFTSLINAAVQVQCGNEHDVLLPGKSFERFEVIGMTEGKYGDEPQSAFSRAFLLGNYSLKISGDVSVESRRHKKYWTAELELWDGLGTQRHDFYWNRGTSTPEVWLRSNPGFHLPDLVYPFVSFFTPSRDVLRASWSLTGVVDCCGNCEHFRPLSPTVLSAVNFDFSTSIHVEDWQ